MFQPLRIAGSIAAVVRVSVPNVGELDLHGHIGPIPPTDRHPLKFLSRHTLTADDWKSILYGRKTLSVWGIIRYDSGFSEAPGEIGFGFEFDPSHASGGYGERFSLIDLPGYNYST